MMLLQPQLLDLARGLAGRDYADIRSGYLDAIGAAMVEYLQGDASITRFRNSYKRAVLEFFDVAFFSGYIDSGGQVASMSDEDRDWFLAKQAAELGYVDMLFQDLKALRKSAEGTQDLVGVAMDHAGGYAHTLDGLYAEGFMRGARGETYVFEGDDGAESCPECQSMKGKEHNAAWIVERNAIPYPGTSFYSCKGYQCQHFWRNIKTGEVLGRS
jgi:hypothetical protein